MTERPPGRIVLVYFSNPTDADNFVAFTKERVVGVYEDPKGKTCTCKSQQNERTKEFGNGPQHPYWGWQRHRCGRAGVWWRRNYGKRLFLALGTNLLGDQAPKIFQPPQGWGHENHKPGEGEI